MEKTIVYVIKSDNLCLISDCDMKKGFDYEYHRTTLKNLLFDGNKCEDTYHKNWYLIKKIPNKIENKNIKFKDGTYKIKDDNMICDKFPETIKCSDISKYEFDVTEYYWYVKGEEYHEFEDVTDKYDLQVVLEVDNLKEPKDLTFKSLNEDGWSKAVMDIKPKDLTYAQIDKILLPNIMLSYRPCSLSRKQMYQITKQHILENIDSEVATVSGNYSTYFEVTKKVKLFEPETIQYSNIFGRTKKERNKIQYHTKEHKTYEVFSMTLERNHRGWLIEPLYGNNHEDLERKVKIWLDYVIECINEKVELCPHCNGIGHKKPDYVTFEKFRDIPSEDLKIETNLKPRMAVDVANNMDTSVRITHIPTGIVVEHDSNKSQLKSKIQAIEILQNKLMEER